jgi:uncharacterized PurR-regulated membrane protein YhhQ (DUF165 family)
MIKLFVINALIVWGFAVVCYETYKRIRGRRGGNDIIWLIAGLVTMIGTILDSTVLVYFARAGHEQSMFYLHNIINAVMLITWIYVAYKEGCFHKR